MPFKRRPKTRAKRPVRPVRRFKKRASRRVNTVYQRGTQVIAPRTIAKMKYVETISQSMTASLFADYFYNLNSIFDPNRSGIGHQPMGHDTYATLYNRYRVFAVSYAVTFPSLSAVYQICVSPVNHANSASSYDATAEQTRAISKTVSAGSSPVTIKGTVYLPSVLGTTSSQYKANENTQAQFGSNPSEIQTLRLTIMSATTQVIAPIKVAMVYHTELFDPLEIAQS